MRAIAVIPARAGSKRLPGKNLRLLHNKPLIVWSIEIAKAAAIDEIVVTTDGLEIAAVAEKAGAKVIMRPGDLASDGAETLPAVRHAVADSVADAIVLLQPTSPLRSVSDIVNCMTLHESSRRPVVSVCRASHGMYWCGSDGVIEKAEVPNEVSLVYPNGAVYVCSKAKLFNGYAWWEQPVSYVMPPERSVDIDTLVDFRLAELLLQDAMF